MALVYDFMNKLLFKTNIDCIKYIKVLMRILHYASTRQWIAVSIEVSYGLLKNYSKGISCHKYLLSYIKCYYNTI